MKQILAGICKYKYTQTGKPIFDYHVQMSYEDIIPDEDINLLKLISKEEKISMCTTPPI